MVAFKGDPSSKNQIDERKKAFEAKYHRDEELTFKTGMRRAKLFGRLVAEQLHLQGDDADDYVRRMVEQAVTDSQPLGLVNKAMDDLERSGQPCDQDRLLCEMERLGALAHQQILAEIAQGTQRFSSTGS